jgi:pyruvate ferredoxin oxidoreductase alpha subunit
MVRRVVTGVIAIANAVKLADVDVITAYPIRPYTGVMNELARMIADGEFDAEYIVSDCEHSQFEMAKHASMAGARVFTGSAGIGFAYAYEPVVVAASDRAPVVAMLGDRTLDDPGCFGVEHTDALADRDLGWMMFFAENAQEALDLTLIAYRVAEDARVLLPALVCCDGHFITHVYRPVDIPESGQVKAFLPPYNRQYLLDPDRPVSIAPQVGSSGEHAYEFRRQMVEAMGAAREVISKASVDFGKIFGRKYPPFIEEYMVQEADAVLIILGNMSMGAREAARQLRAKGERVGVVRIRAYRPFPDIELQEALAGAKAVGVVDCNYSYGSPLGGGIVFHDVRSALYGSSRAPPVVDFFAGLGGREVTVEDFIGMFRVLLTTARTGKAEKNVYWIGLRE